jgi:hypothetical protein
VDAVVEVGGDLADDARVWTAIESTSPLQAAAEREE